MLKIGYFPTGLKAPAMATPHLEPASADGTAIALEFRQELQSMDQLLRTCEEKFGEGPFATHQIIGPLSASQWRQFHLLHARHHLKQIRHLG